MLKILVMLAVLLTGPEIKAYLKAAFAPANASNWVLAGLGVIGGFVGLFTLRTIKKQIKAQMNADRAWVLIHKVINPPPLQECIEKLISPAVGFRMKVCGTTPARIVRERYRCHIVPAVPKTYPSIPQLDKSPVYTNEGYARKEMMAPGILPEVVMVGIESTSLKNNDITDLMMGKSALCAYGCIEYHDAFGRDGITKFLYVYRFGNGIQTPDGTDVAPSGFTAIYLEGYSETT
ncbi:hypothetical protein [Granulicella sp. S156]|uniref:hypothetical protein n=1 Tax=Granulicella sp. S156 TaxID=1747224 RepID=UPI00131E0924|nr:hypothetical protein [Granulicella sp. S156]